VDADPMQPCAQPRRTPGATSAQLALAVAMAMGCLAAIPAGAAPGDGCDAAHFIDATLATGGRWQLCWEARAEEGVVLSDVYYNAPGAAARKVLAEASLSQVHVSDDDGAPPQLLVTGTGLGGPSLRTLAAHDCPGGTRLADAGRDVLCRQSEPAGFLYKYYDTQKQSEALRLHHLSQIGDVVYAVQWRLFDTGVIEPAVRASGRVPRTGSDPRYGWPLDDAGTIGIGRVHSYVWRLAFDLADNGANDVVEEIEFVPTSSSTRLSRSTVQLTTETGRSVEPTLMRSWRIVDDDVTNADGHRISYHLDPLDLKYRYDGGVAEPWSEHDFWVTVTRACERFAVGNPTGGGCAADVSSFADGESIDRAHLTVWHAVSAYRVPRAEDTPFVNGHWDGFRISPRDWYSESRF
jgi:primary-amine oxidase